MCDIIDFIADNLVYFDIVQNFFGPAGYFRDPRDLEKYLADSVFLPFTNNERDVDANINKRFGELNGAMFVMFSEDTVVYPRESEWFWELQADGSILKVEDTDFYKNDNIGLRKLMEAGKVVFEEFEG